MSKTKQKDNYTKKKWPIVLLIVIAIVLVIAIGIVIFANYMTGGMKTVKLDVDDLGIVTRETSATQETDEAGEVIEEDKIINIALFGVDTRDESAEIGDKGRSDSIIILSVNITQNKANMISVLRDTKVPIEGHDPQKINAAYKYGGAPLAIKTLNQNFKLDIANYLTVDFGSLETIIDIVGGVDIYLEPVEAEYVNDYAYYSMGYGGYDVVEGWNTLNGAHAVSYSRIRSIDSDYYRAGRQQAVLNAILSKIREKPVSQYPEMLRNLLDCVETSYTFKDLLTLINSLDIKNTEVNTYTMPDPDYEPNLFGGLDETGSWVWIYDLDLASDRIHGIIYGK